MNLPGNTLKNTMETDISVAVEASFPADSRVAEFEGRNTKDPLFKLKNSYWAQELKDRQSIKLTFQVSLNEEHTFLMLSLGDAGNVDLGERVHHYSLLTLARRRLSDAQDGLDQSSQGWIDFNQLARMLGLEPSHLNIQIYRIRKQIACALRHPILVPEFIERRRGELRFGALSFRILRGSCLEGEFSAEASERSAYRFQGS